MSFIHEHKCSKAGEKPRDGICNILTTCMCKRGPAEAVLAELHRKVCISTPPRRAPLSSASPNCHPLQSRLFPLQLPGLSWDAGLWIPLAFCFCCLIFFLSGQVFTCFYGFFPFLITIASTTSSPCLSCVCFPRGHTGTLARSVSPPSNRHALPGFQQLHRRSL